MTRYPDSLRFTFQVAPSCTNNRQFQKKLLVKLNDFIGCLYSYVSLAKLFVYLWHYDQWDQTSRDSKSHDPQKHGADFVNLGNPGEAAKICWIFMPVLLKTQDFYLPSSGSEPPATVPSEGGECLGISSSTAEKQSLFSHSFLLFSFLWLIESFTPSH